MKRCSEDGRNGKSCYTVNKKITVPGTCNDMGQIYTADNGTGEDTR